MLRIEVDEEAEKKKKLLILMGLLHSNGLSQICTTGVLFASTCSVRSMKPRRGRSFLAHWLCSICYMKHNWLHIRLPVFAN